MSRIDVHSLSPCVKRSNDNDGGVNGKLSRSGPTETRSAQRLVSRLRQNLHGTPQYHESCSPRMAMRVSIVVERRQ